MTFKDLKNFTYGEIGTLTPGQLELDKFELLNLAASGKISFPDTTWEKLCDLCKQTVNDFNGICPSNQLDAPECISSPSPHQMTPERIMQIITFIMAVITFIRSVTLPQTEPTNVTINNYDISPKDQETLLYDIYSILKYLSYQEEI